MSLILPAIPSNHERRVGSAATATTSGSVLFLAAGSESYGIERCFLSLTAALTRRGTPPTFALLSRGGLDSVLESRGVSVIYPPRMRLMRNVNTNGWRKVTQLGRRTLSQMLLVPWLTQQVRARSLAAIIVRNPLEVALAAVVAWRTGVTAYWMMPNTVSDTYPLDINRRIYRFMFQHMNLVPVANSRYTDSTLGDGDYERHVVHLGIDVDAFSPDQPTSLSRQDIGLPKHAVVLGVFARLTVEKGQKILTEALASLGEDGSDIHLLIVGGPIDNSFAKRLAAYIDKRGLADRVHLVGPITDVVPYYQVCDVVVNSRLDPEPFGFSAIEGMAMGKPVLAHRAGGPGETIIDGSTGWLFDTPTPEAFAAALRRVLADRPRWPEMSRAARHHAATNFSDGRMLSDLTGVLQRT